MNNLFCLGFSLVPAFISPNLIQIFLALRVISWSSSKLKIPSIIKFPNSGIYSSKSICHIYSIVIDYPATGFFELGQLLGSDHFRIIYSLTFSIGF